MPKISSNNLRVYHKDVDERYQVDVMYNKELHFFARIPVEFHKVIHHLDREELEKMFITITYKRARDRYDSNIKGIPTIYAETEESCLDRMKECIKAMLNRSIDQRDVILIHFRNDNQINFYGHQYNKQHPQLGMQFGLTYAVETSVGDRKVYSIYEQYGFQGEKRHVNRKELHIPNEVIVLPDTPDNREVLEKLYTTFKTLLDKIEEFTSSEEKVLMLISSNLKMLGL